MAHKYISPNKWRVTVSVRDPRKGHPVSKSKIVIGTKGDAITTESEMRKELQARSLKKAYAVTFGEAVDLYIETVRINGRYSKSYARQVDFVRRELGHVRIEDIAERFAEYRKDLMKSVGRHGTNRKGGTINVYTAIVSAVCNHLVAIQIIDKNPITKANFPKFKETPRDRVLVFEEKMRFLSAIQQHRPYIEPIVRYMWVVPCRINELLGARRNQYNPFTNTIYIPTSKAGIPIVKPVPPDMVDYFRSIPEDCEWLFYREEGGKYLPIRATYLAKAWDFCLKQAGVFNYRRHDTRHESITALINSGSPANVVATVAGWTSTAMLKNYYHVDGLNAARLVVFPGETKVENGNIIAATG